MVSSALHDIAERVGLDPELCTVRVLTPRFQTSKHVVCLVFGADSRPDFVLKFERQAEPQSSLKREYCVLQLAHGLSGGICTSAIPRPIALGEYEYGYWLAETALSGTLLDAKLLRADFDTHVKTLLDWLISFNSATFQRVDDRVRADWFQSVVLRSIGSLNERSASYEIQRLVEATLSAVDCLSAPGQASVFEHGDLSHPNILLRSAGGVGIVDWEEGESEGLPAADLFIYLAFAGEARSRSNDLDGFEDTFFAQRAWAIPYIRQYADCFAITPQQMVALFLVCWARYTARLAVRAHLDVNALPWLRSNKYYKRWTFAMEHAPRLLEQLT
jgi:aminoglycoside phosphotransferase (APT) family kinase protein